MRVIFVPAVTSETELALLANGISEETLKYCPLKPRGFPALQLGPFSAPEITCPSHEFINYIIISFSIQKLKPSNLLEIPTHLLATHELSSAPHHDQLSSAPRSQLLSWNQARCHQVEA